MSKHHKIQKTKNMINTSGIAIPDSSIRVGVYERHDDGFCQAHNQLRQLLV